MLGSYKNGNGETGEGIALTPSQSVRSFVESLTLLVTGPR